MKSCGFSKQAEPRQVLVLLQLGRNALQLKLLRLSQHSWLGFIQLLPGSWNSIRIINRFFCFSLKFFIWSFLFFSFITLFFRSLRGAKFMEISESWSKRTLSSSFPSLLKRFPCVGIFQTNHKNELRFSRPLEKLNNSPAVNDTPASNRGFRNSSVENK